MAEKRKAEQLDDTEDCAPAEKRLCVIQFYDASRAYGCLSNFWPCSLQYNGLRFATAEHLYQYKKYDPTQSEAVRKYTECIRTAKTPYMAKLLANQTICHQYGWMEKLNTLIQQAMRDSVSRRKDFDALAEMEAVLRLKFDSSAAARKVLVGSAPHSLAEHTRRDSFWADGGDGTGQNHLGKLLLKIRDNLQRPNSEFGL